VALELQATGVGESFKAKLPDLAALEVCLKGAAFVCVTSECSVSSEVSRRDLKLPVPCCRLPNKVVSRRRMTCPRSCSLCPLPGGASSGLRYIAAASPSRSGMSGGFLRSTRRKEVEALYGHVGCHK
jgi:hypothetical protein